MSDILDELQWRGLVAQTTDETALRKALADGPITAYCGFDPTAPSLHIGNLVQLVLLRHLQRAGHRVLCLVGGSTGLIGDPKPTAERQLNPRETVAEWVARIQRQVRPFLDFDGDNPAVMVNNLDWTAPLSAIDFLRDIGRHFRVNTMIKKDAVAARLASHDGISYSEFSYQVLQGMDYLHLFREYGCTLQTGAVDQWGNILAGSDLIHRVEGESVHVLTTPLVTKADGTKFGKTEGGTVWLDADLMSPYAFYQFWINVEDASVVDYLKIFTTARVRRSRSWSARCARSRSGARRSGPSPRTSPRWCMGPKRPRPSRRPARPCSARGTRTRSTSVRCATPPPSCPEPRCRPAPRSSTRWWRAGWSTAATPPAACSARAGCR